MGFSLQEHRILSSHDFRHSTDKLSMTVRFFVNRGENLQGPEDEYPTEVTADQYQQLADAVDVLEALWAIEEYYDSLLRNAVDLRSQIARYEAERCVFVSSPQRDQDTEIRNLNRLFGNFLFTARAFVDGIKVRLGQVPSLKHKSKQFNALLSEQFDTYFSYRFMDALRNYTQHHGIAIHQTLTWLRNMTASDGSVTRVLSVALQIDRDQLLGSGKLKAGIRNEIKETCSEMIDLLPHLTVYVECFGRTIINTRQLFAEEYEAALQSQKLILKRHLIGEWSHVLITPSPAVVDPAYLSIDTHLLRRLRDIRYLNYAQAPST